MNVPLRPAVWFLALTIFLGANGAAAQDVVTVGTVTTSGSTVDVPIYIRDAAGTSLGMDQPPGSKIQSLSISVSYSPASAVSSVTIGRDGITANLTPTSEFSPSSPGTISLLTTFQESTNPIPFSLNASAPGDLVAHLVFTLSGSATPGSTITLALDPGLTQLTDSGGTAATKETAANGQLDLVDGEIEIAPLTLALTPSSTSVTVGGETVLRVTASSIVSSATTVELTSSDPEFATVPPSAVILAGQRRVDFAVTGVAIGSATITAALSPSLGGASDSSNVTVIAAPPQCPVPAVPQVSAPATAGSGASYTISWPAVANATDYVIQEATNPAFTGATSTTVTATSATFTHTVSSNTSFYYRVRARNRSTGCDTSSANSTSVTVLVEVEPPPPVQEMRVLPVVGSTPGEQGSFFKTSVQLFNPHDAAISGRILVHRLGAPDTSLAYALASGKTVAYADLLPAMGLAGIGTADLIGDVGSPLPVASVRVFNDAGAAGTTGLSEEALDPADALQAGQSGALIAPADFTLFRLNVGVRTLDQGATVNIVVRDREGAIVKTVDRSYPPTFFQQVPSTAFLDGYALTGGESITIRLSSGSAFIYGATTDNKTNDPTLQLARPVE
jgi:hypothetical protein